MNPDAFVCANCGHRVSSDDLGCEKCGCPEYTIVSLENNLLAISKAARTPKGETTFSTENMVIKVDGKKVVINGDVESVKLNGKMLEMI